MIPATALCRCGRPVEIRGGAQQTSGYTKSGERFCRDFWWAGGECSACGRIVQYGYGGDRGDYQHCRWWFIDKHAESAPGMVRRWPAEWGFTPLGESVQ